MLSDAEGIPNLYSYSTVSLETALVCTYKLTMLIVFYSKIILGMKGILKKCFVKLYLQFIYKRLWFHN